MILFDSNSGKLCIKDHVKDVMKDKHQNGAYLWAAGEEWLNVDVGVVHFEIVVPETSGDPDGCQHTSLQKKIRGT